MLSPSPGWSVSLAPAALLFVLSLVALPLTLAGRIDQREAVAVIFPPLTTPVEAVTRIAAVGGRPLAAGGVPGVWLVRANESADNAADNSAGERLAESFVDGLYGAGAWLVLGAAGAGGCGAGSFRGTVS